MPGILLDRVQLDLPWENKIYTHRACVQFAYALAGVRACISTYRSCIGNFRSGIALSWHSKNHSADSREDNARGMRACIEVKRNRSVVRYTPAFYAACPAIHIRSLSKVSLHRRYLSFLHAFILLHRENGKEKEKESERERHLKRLFKQRRVYIKKALFHGRISLSGKNVTYINCYAAWNATG